MFLRIALASLLLLTGCASQPPVPDDRDAATKVSEGVGEASGKVATGIVRGIVEFVPGLESAINGVDTQLQNRRNRAQNRNRERLENERNSRLFEFCSANPCQTMCREHLIKEIGVAPDCKTTTQVQPPTNPSFNPTRHTPNVPAEISESTIVQHEGLRTSEYTDTRGIKHVGVGSRVWTDTEITSAEAIVERFSSDIAHAEEIAQSYAGDLAWRSASEAQRLVLVELAFALGPQGLKGFSQMRQYIQSLDWDSASNELLNSKWHESDPKRVQTLASNLRVSDHGNRANQSFDLAR